MRHQPILWKRRSALKALAFGALFPRRLVTAAPSNPDVVIVGAGAAGLAAANKLIKGTCTRWGQNHLTEGAYASAKPGMFRMRAALREPVAERIFFAGEACHPTMWATVGGAVASGADTAAATAQQLSA